jgi:signal peptidase II
MEKKKPRAVWKQLDTIFNFILRNWKEYLVLFLIAGVFLFLDQWTKTLVRENIPLGTDWLPDRLAWLMPYARIRHWHNTGAAFGLFQGGSLVFTILAFIVSGFILYYFPRVPKKEWWLRFALGLQLCGAIGNLIDRLRFDGKVTDFISVGNFAIFNIADSCITVGTIILVAGIFLTERAEKKRMLIEKGEDETNRSQAE